MPHSLPSHATPAQPGPKPAWLKVRLGAGERYAGTAGVVRQARLSTVCESAACPNRGECWSNNEATFMLLGNTCTRACGFCNVRTGRPTWFDDDEPRRVAEAAARLELDYVVLTSVNRDDLPDGGARMWAETVGAVRERLPRARVETLIPDFAGDSAALDTVLFAVPDVLAHNVETIPRLYRRVRPGSSWERSLSVLNRAADAGLTTKSGMMLGIGENPEEIPPALEDLRRAGASLLTLGQYLQPTRRHLPVHRWVTPEEFDELRRVALAMGFAHAECGPLVRSSYRAGAQHDASRTNRA